MIIPDKLKVGGHFYEVLKHFDRAKIDGDNNLGTHSGTFLKIWLETNMSLSMQEDVFFHELVEAINFQYNIELNHHQVSLVSSAFYQVLTDNQMLKEGGKDNANKR